MFGIISILIVSCRLSMGCSERGSFFVLSSGFFSLICGLHSFFIISLIFSTFLYRGINRISILIHAGHCAKLFLPDALQSTLNFRYNRIPIGASAASKPFSTISQIVVYSRYILQDCRRLQCSCSWQNPSARDFNLTFVLLLSCFFDVRVVVFCELGVFLTLFGGFLTLGRPTQHHFPYRHWTQNITQAGATVTRLTTFSGNSACSGIHLRFVSAEDRPRIGYFI